jgi:hypothetical protein
MDHGSPRDWFAVTFLGYPRNPGTTFSVRASLFSDKTEDCLNIAARFHLNLNQCK